MCGRWIDRTPYARDSHERSVFHIKASLLAQGWDRERAHRVAQQESDRAWSSYYSGARLASGSGKSEPGEPSKKAKVASTPGRSSDEDHKRPLSKTEKRRERKQAKSSGAVPRAEDRTNYGPGGPKDPPPDAAGAGSKAAVLQNLWGQALEAWKLL